MNQQISLMTLGVADVERSKSFYREGFGWQPVFENEDIAFFQMNGFVFALWGQDDLAGDMQRAHTGSSGFALAHNVESASAVDDAIERLVAAGATLLRAADEPPHGGFRGYVADPDGHAWEIAWNPVWKVDKADHVQFAS